MERLDLRHLRTLCAIADTGSLRRAAAAQGYSQPALSTQLQRIEQYFGEPLFARSSIGVVPTAVGGEIVAQARDVLARTDAIGPRGRRSHDECHAVRLAATNTAILSGLVTRFRDAAPQCSMTVSSVYSSKEIVGMLEEGLVDIAIGGDYPGQELRHSSIVAHRGIVTEPSFVAVPAGHPLAAHLLAISPLPGPNGPLWVRVAVVADYVGGAECETFGVCDYTDTLKAAVLPTT